MYYLFVPNHENDEPVINSVKHKTTHWFSGPSLSSLDADFTVAVPALRVGLSLLSKPTEAPQSRCSDPEPFPPGDRFRRLSSLPPSLDLSAARAPLTFSCFCSYYQALPISRPPHSAAASTDALLLPPVDDLERQTCSLAGLPRTRC